METSAGTPAYPQAVTKNGQAGVQAPSKVAEIH